jgi:hypothetical protein
MRWLEAEAWVHGGLGIDGKAGVTDAWRAQHGNPPQHVLVRGKGVGSKPVVLRTFTRTGDDEDIVLTHKQLVEIAGEASTPLGATIKYRAAGRLTRLWYTPGAVLAVITAVTGWLATVITAGFAYVRLMTDGSKAAHSGGDTVSGWLLLFAAVVLGITAVAATAKLLKDLRDARK